MSTNLAHDLRHHPLFVSTPSEEGAERTHIRAVTSPARRAKPRVLYALVTVAGLFMIVVSQLLLSVGVSEGAYEISGLQEQQKSLSRTAQSLAVQLDSVASPQNLAANAEALGMVRDTNPSAFLRLSDGKVLGVPRAAAKTTGSDIGAGKLVPNALLKPPVVAKAPAAGKAAAGAAGAGAGATGATGGTPTAPGAAVTPVLPPNTLPAPTTH